MKYLYLLFFFATIITVNLKAQECDEISQAQGYASQIFYDIATKTSTSFSHEDWDIAFGVDGFSSAVLVNEGVASSQAAPPAQIALFASTSNDFATADTLEITDRLYNDEVSWEDGAFNIIADTADPFDLGWGSYSPATQTVTGDQVYFLLDRAGVYRKIVIESLISGTYTFRYANLDGTNEQTVSINKTDFAGKTMAYFSFANGVVDLEPDSWDLLFTRYVTPLPDGEGNILDYTVTGVLHNKGITVAELSGVDPFNESVPSDENQYETALDVIGFDWKSFDLGTFSWNIPDDLVYFVRKADGTIYRMQFVDFQGSSTGITTVCSVDEGLISSLDRLPAFAESVSLFPNPARQFTHLQITTKLSGNAKGKLTLLNAFGQVIPGTQHQVALVPGENKLALDLNKIPSGQYLVQLCLADSVIVQPLVITQ